MGHLAKVIVVIVAFVAFSEGKITVISTLCQTETPKGTARWMKCPTEATAKADSTREFLDNISTEDEEQKFCCGQSSDRFCCSLAEKLREIPGFDPESHHDRGTRYRYQSGHWGFWHYLFLMAMVFFSVAAITYIFGCVIFEVIYCLCCCCGRKKKSTSDLKQTSKKTSSGKKSPYPDESESSTLIVVNTATAKTSPQYPIQTSYQPMNYQAIPPTSNFGGSADLYQNVTRNSPPPPPYSSMMSQPSNVHV